MPARIGVIGDRQWDHPPHQTIGDAVCHADHLLGTATAIEWVDTDTIDPNTIDPEAEDALHRLDGLWIAPGSPYRSMDGALHAITVARTSQLPLLGTCGGFQHMVVEYARQVVGFVDAQHAEYDPYASDLFVSELTCSLASQTMRVSLRSGTRASAAYGAAHADERYYCNFGLAPGRARILEDAGLVVSGVDGTEPRVVELPDHPFYLGTLFVPQTSSTAERPHPLVVAFVRAVHARQGAAEGGQRNE